MRNLRPIRNTTVNLSGPSLYGSPTAGRFLVDAMNGTDSIDVVLIGDSNTSYNDYGYCAGIDRSLGYSYGIPPYATTMIPGGLESGATTRETRSMMIGTLDSWTAATAAGASGTVQTLTNAVTAADADAVALKNGLSIDTSLLPKWLEFEWRGSFVASGVSYTSSVNQNYFALRTSNPINNGFASGGVSCQYRCVYGKFATTGGQFKPVVWSSGGSTVASQWTSTSGGSAGNWFGTATLNFTTASGTVIEHRCGWDGFSQGVPTSGPFACLWHSTIKRNQKGYAVNHFIYHGGLTTTQIADRVEAAGDLFSSYMKEVRQRQIEAGGSGRVIVFVNSGINGPDTASGYTTAINRIVNRCIAKWVQEGGSESNIAFVITPTHPVVSVAGNSWNTDRSAVAAAAVAYAQQNAGRNVTAFDINTVYPTSRLLTGTVPAGTLYDAGGQSHLTSTTSAQTNGYDAVAHSIISSLIANA